MAGVAERLASAQSAVEQSCHLLLTPNPECLDRSAGALSLAIGELAAGRDLLASSTSNPRALAQICEIRSKVRLASRLLENAAAYHSGWNRILGSMVAGYTPHGAAPVVRPGRLAVEG
jgi:hypothetical protein